MARTAGSPVRSPRPWPTRCGHASGPGGMAKKVPATVVLASPGRDDKQGGTGPLVTVTGDPGELTMFGAGRQQAARVEITGDATLAAQLRAASLGV